MHGPHRFVSLFIGLALVAAALAFSACGSAGTSTPARSASPTSSPGTPTSSPGTLRDQQDRLSITYDPKRLAARVTRSFGRTFITLRVLGSDAMPDTLKIQPEMYGSLLDSNASISAWIQAHSTDPHTSATRLNGVRGLMTSHAPPHGPRSSVYVLRTPHGLYDVDLTAWPKTATRSWPLLTSALRNLRITP